jgi:Holliday junction resolvase RusA-like endonuclease
MRPDRTNYLKGFEDALQGIVYVNDSQVVDGPILKEYADGPEGYTVVWIQELTEVTSQ